MTHAMRMSAPAAPDLAALRFLASPAGSQAIEAVAAAGPSGAGPGAVVALRRQWGEPLAGWILRAAALRRRAAEKLACQNPLATDRALQQATDHSTAAYKASRFPRGPVVVDVCCGLGGDLVALARRGPVVGIDSDPRMCVIAAHHLHASQIDSSPIDSSSTRLPPGAILCQPAERFEMPAGAWLHIDPDRRPDDKRASSPEYCQPAVATIDRLLAGAAGGAVKLAPAADVPAHWHESLADREWISRRGSCRQQVAWFLPTGGPQRRRATVVHGAGQSVTFSVLQRELEDLRSGEVDGPGRWLVDFDPAVRAAGLSHALANHLGLAAIGGPAGFFTCDEPPRSGEMQGPPRSGEMQDVERGLFTPFRVLWQGAMDEKSLRRRIRQYDPPSLEIKVRGAGIRPEALRERLLKRGAAKPDPDDRAELVLLVGRRGLGGATYAAIAERAGSEWRV